MTNETPQALVGKLVQLLDVEQLDLNLYRGARTDEPWKRVYGGQVIGQALAAATRTVEASRPAHSLHAYFIRPGDPSLPIIYQVSRDRDGKSFTTRRVVALQHGQPILNMAASFQIVEDGLAHQFEMPDVAPPEALKSNAELLEDHAGALPEVAREWLARRRPLEFRPVEPRFHIGQEKAPPRQNYWFRAIAPLPDDPALHRSLLAYATDMMLLSTSLLPHGVHWFTNTMQEASLDHAVWFHAPARVDEWLLYALDSPWSGHARGMNRGLIYTRDGRLAASTAQEGLIRQR